MWFKTTKVLLTTGHGTGGQALVAFDCALRTAGIADFNLIRVTSIVPPGIPVINLVPTDQLIRGEGRMIPTVYETICSNKVGAEISVAVGVGLTPQDEPGAGIIYTYSCFGPKIQADKTIREMIAETMKLKSLHQHRCEVAVTSAVVKKPWTSVLAAALFCDKDLDTIILRSTAHTKSRRRIKSK